MNCSQRVLVKNLLAVGTGDAQALLDVRLGFFRGERVGLGAQSQALPQLPQVGLLEFGFGSKSEDKEETVEV